MFDKVSTMSDALYGYLLSCFSKGGAERMRAETCPGGKRPIKGCRLCSDYNSRIPPSLSIARVRSHTPLYAFGWRVISIQGRTGHQMGRTLYCIREVTMEGKQQQSVRPCPSCFISRLPHQGLSKPLVYPSPLSIPGRLPRPTRQCLVSGPLIL